MRFLGIDIGTSAVKLCLTDADGAVLATQEAALSLSHPFAGASEQNPEAWYAALRAAMLGLAAEDRARVGALGLSGQMHGAVCLDAALRPIRPAILWNDGRAALECRDMAQAVPEIGQIAGVPPMPGFTAPKLLWLSRHAPEDHACIHKILLPKDYIGFRLHGNLYTDPSDAAGTHWLEQATGAWSSELCRVSATNLDWLPSLRFGIEAAGQLLPDAASDLGLPPGIPIATGAGDAAAGAIGIGAIDAGDGFLSLGTSGQVFVTIDSYRPNPESLVHAYAHTMPGMWFQMACMLNGARPMAWLSELLQRPIGDLTAEAETAEPGPLFLPYLTGERTPHGDSAIRAGFWGLGEGTSHGSLMRAVVEGIAFSFADATAALRAAGTTPAKLRAIGGGTRSDFLLQMIADVTDTPIGRSDGAEVGPALGAARLARVAAGHTTLAEVAEKPPVSKWFQPNPTNQATLSRRLAGYRRLYPALASVSEAMEGAVTMPTT